MSLVLFNQYLQTLGWIFALVITLVIAFFGMVVIFDILAWKLDVWKELRRKNVAVAILVSAIILGASLIIGSIV